MSDQTRNPEIKKLDTSFRWYDGARKGFTLIELSIVLVIIGLIIGGVLVGRDLIKAAELRQTGSLIEQSNLAVNTFKLKYNCLPGDCKNATQFGIAGAINGDGNEKIEFAGFVTGFDEANQFYSQLITTNLMKDARYCTLKGTTCSLSGDWQSSGYGLLIPVGSIQSSQYSTVPPAITVISTYISNTSLTPSQSYKFPFQHRYSFNNHAEKAIASMETSVAAALDRKFDDGLPLSGIILALAGNDDNGVADDNIDYVQANRLKCMNRTTTPFTYFSNTYNPENVCHFSWKADF